MTAALRFQRLTANDLPLLHEWLQREHVRAWWSRRESFEEVVEHYLPAIDGRFKDFTALGDVTNIAARLTAGAAPGEILMDADTYDAVDGLHPGAQRRELELKGKSAPVEAFAIHTR